MIISNQKILFTNPGTAKLVTELSADLTPPPGRILIKTEYSIVSAGTELACLAGIEGWAPLPFCPGYGSVGKVLACGEGSREVSIGQRVLTFGKHSQHALDDAVIVPVPDGLDPAAATFARMASIAFTGLRVSAAELGDTVTVIGLGLIGNLAAQLFALAGCEVIGIDPSPARREQARACGIPHVIPSGPDLAAQVAAITGGRMCDTVVDATGLSAVVLEAAPMLCGKQGEIVLLGSPRAPHAADVTPFLSQLHLCRPTATVKGALEWRYPLHDDGQGFNKHSIERNVRYALRLLAQGKLRVEPLLTHRASPMDCQTIYDGLTHHKDTYTGVVFDWSKTTG